MAPGVPVLDLNAVARRVTTTTDVERTVLLVLALVIALAGLVLAGQVVARSASTIATDARTLGAMGMPRRAVALAATLSHAPAAAVTAVACAGAAVRGVGAAALRAGRGPRSGHGPAHGPARHRRRRARADGAAARRVLPRRVARAPAARRSSSVTTRVVRWPGSVATRRWSSASARPWPSDAGAGSAGVPVRPALLGAVVGVLGVAGAATVDAGLHDALGHPERAGVVWDVVVLPPDPTLVAGGGAVDDAVIDEVRSAPGVRGGGAGPAEGRPRGRHRRARVRARAHRRRRDQPDRASPSCPVARRRSPARWRSVRRPRTPST